MNRIDIIDNLIKAFPGELKDPGHNLWNQLRSSEAQFEKEQPITIGCEIEVRWRHYFPELWEKYMANVFDFRRLSVEDQHEMSYECSVIERELLPRLKATEDAGIPKGKDRYYEFANAPAYHPLTLATEVNILRDLNLIPKGVKHSLHITIGGLGHSRDSGLLLMALEILGYTSPERIAETAVSDKAVSWGRKGRAGMRERSAADLSLGTEKAIELRTLELPTTDREVFWLFARAHMMARSIVSKDENQFMKWLNIVDELEQLGRWHDIDTWTNWGAPYDNPEIWKDFAKKLPLIDNTRLKELVDEL